MKLGLGIFFAICVVLAAAFADASVKGQKGSEFAGSSIGISINNSSGPLA